MPRKDLCKIACTECHLCVHSFTCTCTDSLIMSTIYKHVHLVKGSILQDPSQPPSDDSRDTSMDCPQEIENILTCIRSHPDDIDSSKRRIKSMFLQIMGEVVHCTSSAALRQLEKQMRAAINANIESIKEYFEDTAWAQVLANGILSFKGNAFLNSPL